MVRYQRLIEAVGTHGRGDYGSLYVHTIFLRVSLRKSHKVIRKTPLARTDFIGRRISVSFKTVVKQRRTAALRSNAYPRCDACPFAINIPVCHLSAIAAIPASARHQSPRLYQFVMRRQE